MKTPAMIFVMVALAALCFAGIDDFYTFNATTGNYTPITGTSISSILSDDALSESITLGFGFPYGESTFSTIVVSSNGWVGLGTSLTHSNLSNQLSSGDWYPVLAALWDDTSLGGGDCQYLLSGTAPNRVFTVQYMNLRWNYWADNQFNYQIRLYETGKVDFVYGPSTGGPENASASIGINMSPGGANWFYSVTPGAVPSVSQTAENTSISTWPGAGSIYEFLPTPPATHDLAAFALSGNTTPSVGTPANYIVSVRNRGSNAQTVYQVKLVTSTGTELASVPGTAILANQSLDFTLSWTPTTQGPLILRGRVVLAGDENPNNDQSPPLNVTVMPAGMVVMTIGDGSQQARVPVDMWWRNSLFETLFYPTEIGMAGNISALSFYNTFSTNLPNMPTKIWLGTTTNADLSGGWIPSTQLTLVFDGTVNYLSGQNTVLIALQTVFTYTGGNLVMMVNRPMDTQYYSTQDLFYCQTVGATRSRNIYSDSTTFDPANPPGEAENTGQFPKTSIHMTPLGTDPVAIISPGSIDFGQVLMQTTHSRQVVVMNGGGGTLGVTDVTLTGSAYFSIQNPPALPANLVTGQSIQFNVVYLPTTAGTHTGTLTVTDNLTRVVHTIPISASCIDPTIYTLPYAQNFDAVTVPALPLEWSKIVQTTTTYAYVQTNGNGSFSPPNNVGMYNYDDMAASLLLIAPPYATNIPTNTTRLHFRGRGSSNEEISVVVGIMGDPQNAATFLPIQTVNLNSTWTEYVVSFATYAGTGRNVAFKHGLGQWYQTIYIDDVMLEVIPANDLAALSVTGNQTPSVGNATAYTVAVYNWGSQPQSTYTVKLFSSADVELASVPGVTVAPAQTVQVSVMWTPATEGPMQIYGKVVMAGDQNPLNDPSPLLSVTVMPAGMLVVTIGDGGQQALLPVNMFWRNSLFETIYLTPEMTMFGTVTAISFYNNFVTNLPNKPTKIWLGSTQSQDLSAGWIPATQLTQVFNGNVNYPSGPNTIVIPLQTPFTYAGGNLVMMVNRPMDTTYFSSMDNFYCQTVGTNRTRHVYSDGTEFFPDNPPTESNLTGQFPKTSFHMTPLGPDPIFMVNPASHDFGTVLLNNVQNRNFLVMNAGGGTLTVNSINIAGSPHFTLQNVPTLPVSLNTGQSITFTGRYNPTATGAHTATITINDNLVMNLDSRNAFRTPHTVALSGTCVDPTITELPYLQGFDGVTPPALPVQWAAIIEGSTGPEIFTTNGDCVSPPNCVYMNNYEQTGATMILVAPPYANTIATNLTRVKFHARGVGTNHTLIVGIMANPQNSATFTDIQTVTLTQQWAEYVVSFSTYAGTGRTVAFKHGMGDMYRGIYLDNVMLEFTPQNDLAALSVQGNVTPSVGMATNYVVNVFNWGTNAQNNYQVKLFKQGDIELATVAGTAINPNQTVQVTVPWTPTEQGATYIYGKVSLTGDQNNLNDQSPNYNVTVQPQGLVVLTIGDGSQTDRIPLDMYYMNSLYECMYYPAELSNTIGSIYGVGFYNNFVTDLPNQPTNVWLGTTTSADLSADWIPSTQLTQVFTGLVSYPSGQNLINISFPVPYLYLTGQNLVMMVQRPMDAQYYSYQDVFLTQDGTTLRARNAYSDGTAFDPTSPPGGSASSGFPKTSFFIIPGGVGHLTGTVLGAGNQPLAGVAIQSATGGYSTTTNAQGQYSIQNIVAGNYQFSFTHYGYIDHSQAVAIPEDQTITLNITLQQMPMVAVGGTVVASDTSAGLNGAGIYLQGYADYTASTNAAGVFTIPGVYANFTYNYTVICPGYQNVSGTINVGAGNYNFGTIILNEVAYAPRQVHGEIAGNNAQVELNWLAPDPTALDVVESFEGDGFPPPNWTQTITNTGPANTSGVYPTWCRFGAITISGQPATPPDGVYQAGLWWSYDHQDEWLVTPGFNCPPAAYLSFSSYVFQGSTNGDHYYVKVSTNDGNTWTTLWDASAQTGGWNYYASPIVIDLAMYEGLQLRVAFHAVDGPTNDGLWYVWFIDDIYIGNSVNPVRFLPGELARFGTQAQSEPRPDLDLPLRYSKAQFGAGQDQAFSQPVLPSQAVSRNGSRALVGYRVWRLASGQEGNETAWVALTPQTITGLSLTDTGWGALPNGTYRWAVKAVYTSNVLSVPSLSNPLVKELVTGFISGVVRTTQNAPISGATVTAATYTATTNTAGAYSLVVPVGTYDVTASKQGFISQTVEDVSVLENQTTTVNFHLTPGSAVVDPLVPPAATELTGNYPNPFNPETTIAYALKDPAAVTLAIYNLKGQQMRQLVSAQQPAGYYHVLWDGLDDSGRAVGSGVYFYRMRAGAYQSVKKMLLLE